MTDKQIEGAIKDLMANQNSSTKQLMVFQRLNNLLPKSENVSYENNLRGLIIIYLANSSPDSQISALQLLITCLKRGLFQSSKDFDLANVVLNIAHNTVDEDMEHQELWLKAYSALEIMNGLHLQLYQARTLEMVNITRRVVDSKCSSSLQKINALNMLNQLVIHVNVGNDVENCLITFWVEQICPLMFNLKQNNIQIIATDISYSMLPILQSHIQTECFNNFLTTVEKTYLPIMTNLVNKEDVLYSKLWIFLCKLLAVKFHQGFQVVNMLLTVVEGGFKSQNIDIRLHAFYCWQNLIDSFLLNPDTFFTEKRFKLLILPLRANNGRSENLVQVKFLTWCKLLNALDAKNIPFDKHAVLEQFLQFCFGPLSGEQSLLSWISHVNQVSQGKKYSSVHLMSCKAFLQLFGMKKYIDNELQAKLEYFSFQNPKVFIETVNSKFLIDSVGECCVLLSQMQNSDRFECAAINEALWKSLFYGVDNLIDVTLKQKCCQQLAALILTLTAVARKRTCLITFGLVPLFDIIISNEFTFFKNDKMSEILFIPMVQAVMKKDKAFLQHDVIQIFRKIFIFKSNDADFFKFVQIVLDRFAALNVKDNQPAEKLAMLQNVWLILEEELKQHLQKIKTIAVDEQMCSLVFFDFLMWPVTTLNVSSIQEKIYLKWKELYFSFGLHTSETLQNKLGIKILQSLLPIWRKGTHNLIVANITYFIVNNLNLNEYSDEQFSYIMDIFSLLKTFVLTDNLSADILKIFIKSVKKTFNNSKTYPFCLKDQILDCLTCLLNTYKNTELMEVVTDFVKNFPYSIKYKTDFEKLLHIIKSSGVDQQLLQPVLKNSPLISPETKTLKTLSAALAPTCTTRKRLSNKSKITECSQSDSEILEDRKRGRMPSSKPTVDFIGTESDSGTLVATRKSGRKMVKKPCKPPTNNDKDEKKQQQQQQHILSLLGHDIETMAPVKLIDTTTVNTSDSPKKTLNSDIVFVSVPYKFDPKKLTKSQREKLCKKRDDIPALYADLSQSQTRDFDDSNSLLDVAKSQTAEPDMLNPFSELVVQQYNNLKTDEMDDEDPIIELIPKSKEDRMKESENIKTSSVVTLPDLKLKIVGLLRSPELQRTTLKKSPNVTEKNQPRETITQCNVNEQERSKEIIVKLIPDDIHQLKSVESKLKIIDDQPKSAAPERLKTSDNSSESVEKTDLELIESEHTYQMISKNLNWQQISKKSKRRSKTPPDDEEEPKSVKKNKQKTSGTERIEGEPAAVKKRRRGRKKFAAVNEAKNTTVDSMNATTTTTTILSENLCGGETNSIDPLNTARLEINTADLNSGDREEDVPVPVPVPPVKSEKKKRGGGGRRPSVVKREETNAEGESGGGEQRPAKVLKRKRSTSFVLQEEATATAAAAESQQENLTDIVKIRVSRELQRIKMDIKDSHDYQKNEKRKTRTSINFQAYLEPEGRKSSISPIHRKKYVDEDVVDVVTRKRSPSPRTQQVDEDAATESILIIEPTPEAAELIKTVDQQLIDDNVENSETRTIDSELLVEINEQVPEILNVPPTDMPGTNDFSCRKVLFEPLSLSPSPPPPPSSSSKSDIASSPVCFDTPTRNKELIKDTLEISPIKETAKDSDTAAAAAAAEDNSRKMFHKKSRSAHMIGMVSAKATILSPKKSKKAKDPKQVFFSPTQNRIMKMMEQLGRNSEEEKSTEDDMMMGTEQQINDEDILVFSKELPSPFASPSAGILKKRKLTEDAAALRACKRRRVNFSDPPVSSRKFIANVKLDFVPQAQESRVTRSSKPEQDETNSEQINNSDCVEKTSNEVSVITKNSDFSAECLVVPDAQTVLNNESPATPTASQSGHSDEMKIEPETLIKLILQQINVKDLCNLAFKQIESPADFAEIFKSFSAIVYGKLESGPSEVKTSLV